MKKQKFNGKLRLNKETISQLHKSQMTQVVGGSRVTTCTPSIHCDPDTIAPPTDSCLCEATMGNCTWMLCG